MIHVVVITKAAIRGIQIRIKRLGIFDLDPNNNMITNIAKEIPSHINQKFIL